MAYKNKDVYKFKDINEDKDYLSAKQNADQYGEYKSSDKVTGLFDNAYNILNNQKPEKWDADIMSKDYLEKLNAWQTRPNFSYDVNGDALYQQYKDQYINQGRMAMMDTMGQASAMTGGYGNSYAASVGNQAYQGYLQKLNEVVPDLYNMAYNMYQQEGEDLKYAAEIAHRDYLQKYTENQDAYRNWNSDVNTAFDVADTESAREQGIWGLNSTAANTALDRAIAMFNTKEANEFAAYNADMQENQWYEDYLVQERQAKAAEDAAINADKTAELKAEYEKMYAGWISPEEREAGSSEATKTFDASIFTESEFVRRGKKATINGVSKRFDSYGQYVSAVLEKWYKDGRLTENEVAYIAKTRGITK